MDTSTIFLLTTIISILAKLQILKIHDEKTNKCLDSLGKRLLFWCWCCYVFVDHCL